MIFKVQGEREVLRGIKMASIHVTMYFHEVGVFLSMEPWVGVFETAADAQVYRECSQIEKYSVRNDQP